MADEELALMAHLMRRAGFGATREELEARLEQGYENTVEELLNPESQAPADRLEFLRYHPGFWKPVTSPGMGAATWLYDLINTQRVLQEKMALFWHQVFATGQSKVDHWHEIQNQVDMFRDLGMGDYRQLLVQLAQNPAMIYWLDNCDNHAYAVNENWGRELLELFSMGVGNYTEDDVRECSRAFTGWTLSPNIPRNTYGRYDWGFEYREEDHDEDEKTFLGHTGNFNGEDIIDIVCQQPATARFIARHLYNFFVADEPQVPAWSVTPPPGTRGYRSPGPGLLRLQLQHHRHAAGPFPVRLFQKRPLLQNQESGGDAGRHLAVRRRVRVPGPGHRQPVQAGRLHGPGTPQPAQRRRLAHRRGMD